MDTQQQRYDHHLPHHLRPPAEAVVDGEELVPANLKLVELRTELKKLGLSPSGLKHVLVKRLEDALAQRGRFPSTSPNNNKRTAVSAKGHQRQQLLRQHSPHGSDDGADDREGRYPLEEGEDEDEVGGGLYGGGDEEEDDGEEEEIDSAYQSNNSVDGDYNSGEKFKSKDSKKRKSSSSSSSSSSKNKKSRHQQKKHKKKHRPASSSPSTDSTPLSGYTFVKEARFSKEPQQPQQPQHHQQRGEEIKSLEQFRFEGSTFFFTYQFWRGRTLLHSFEIEAGTFLIIEDDATVDTTHHRHHQQQQQQHSSSSLTTQYGVATSRQRKVVLRWPSPVYYPLLQTWRFHQTYSHFLLHEPNIPFPASPTTSTTANSNSAPSSYPASPLAMAPQHTTTTTTSSAAACLISRLGSVFVQGE